MLSFNKQLKFSSFTGIYDVVIPNNHLLRKIAENIDFSFVNKIMEKCYCIAFGRPAYEPELMLKILFLNYFTTFQTVKLSRVAKPIWHLNSS